MVHPVNCPNGHQWVELYKLYTMKISEDDDDDDDDENDDVSDGK